MKIKSKITLFILINLILYLLSVGLMLFYNNKTYEYQKFNSQIKDFGTSLLNTIILEKDYAKHVSDKTAKIVLEYIENNARRLEEIIEMSGDESDLEILPELLESYKSKFSQIVSNNNEITKLKQTWDEVFDDFYLRSNQLGKKIDGIVFGTYIDGEHIDPIYNSFAISNKTIVNALSRISLAVNEDLLLENNNNLFGEKYEKAFALLEKEKKNMLALSQNSRKVLFLDFSGYMEKHLGRIGGLVDGIYDIWEKNDRLVLQLDAVRKKMLLQEKTMSFQIQSSLKRIRRTNLISALVGVVIVLFFLATGGMVILQSINQPIKRLMGRVRELAKGEGDLSTRLEENTRDEMGKLAAQFNKFIGNIQHIIQSVARDAETLAASSSDYLELSSEMSDGAEQMSEVSNSVSTSTEEVSMSVNTMASAAEEMSVNIQGISSSAEQMSQNMDAVTSAIEDMSSAISDIAKNAQEGTSISGEALQMANSASAAMSTLGGAAKEIGDVTRVITRIAEQTNLLALNATIEAASAGDAGKGFAVVANEIKELANQSAKAAENIALRIRGVQKNTDRAVSVIDDILKIINEMDTSVMVITKAVGQQTHTVNDIMSNVREASISVGNIASAIAEAARGANDMSENAGEAARGANEVASNIQSINQATSEASDRAKKINISAMKLSDIAAQLQEMVIKFRVEEVE